MFAILDNLKKNIDVEERESAPHQIVAVGVHWSRHIEQLVKEFMNDPYVVVTAMEEAALYGGVQQVRARGHVWGWGLSKQPRTEILQL